MGRNFHQIPRCNHLFVIGWDSRRHRSLLEAFRSFFYRWDKRSEQTRKICWKNETI